MTMLSTITGNPARVADARDHYWDELIGLELEVEDLQSPEGVPRITNWNTHNDESLRNGIEFVLRAPLAGSQLERAIDAFYKADMMYTVSPRTSTHIHINMTDSNVATLQSLIMLVYTLEPALYEIIDNSRKWAGYSMPLVEMPPDRIRNLLAQESGNDTHKLLRGLQPGRRQERYYGLNVMSIITHGSLEFRYFRGGPTKEELTEWIDLVVGLKKAASKLTPTQLVEQMQDVGGLMQVLRNGGVKPYWINRLLSAVPVGLTMQQFEDVTAMLSGTEVTRQDPLVFITESLTNYMNKKYPSVEGQKMLQELRENLGVLSLSEWLNHAHRIKNHTQYAGQGHITQTTHDDLADIATDYAFLRNRVTRRSTEAQPAPGAWYDTIASAPVAAPNIPDVNQAGEPEDDDDRDYDVEFNADFNEEDED